MFVLACMARDEVLSKDKDKQKDTHTVASGSWNALGKIATLPRSHAASTASSSESGELLISCRGLLARR